MSGEKQKKSVKNINWLVLYYSQKIKSPCKTNKNLAGTYYLQSGASDRNRTCTPKGARS